MFPSSIKQAHDWLREGRITCRDLTERCFTKIELNEPKINSFITQLTGSALVDADRLDREISQGLDRGLLHGIPIALKDNYDLKGVRTTLGSKLAEIQPANCDADSVSLLKSAGAVIIGKTNMNILSAGVTGTNRHYGDTHFPNDCSYSSGGSSSGSAAAVAANFCLASTGTDTGGSLRIPASWCGLSTIRPTPQLTSTAGIFPRSSSFDVPGPIAKSVKDVRILFNAMTNNSWLEEPGSGSVSKLRIGFVEGALGGCSRTYLGYALRDAINIFAELDAAITSIPLSVFIPDEEQNADLFNTILLYEFNQIVEERFAGVENIPDTFGPLVSRNLRSAKAITATDYTNALGRRKTVVARFDDIFTDIDVLLTPTTTMPAPRMNSPRRVFMDSRRFVVPSALAGYPSVALPCGTAPPNLPLSMQLIGRPYSDKTLLSLAATFQEQYMATK